MTDKHKNDKLGSNNKLTNWLLEFQNKLDLPTYSFWNCTKLEMEYFVTTLSCFIHLSDSIKNWSVQNSWWKMRVLSPLKIVKHLITLAILAIIIFIYLKIQENRLPKPIRPRHFSRYYSTNSTVTSNLPINEKWDEPTKDVAKSSSHLSESHAQEVV